LAVLITLAKRPEGRASLDELADEVALLIAETDKKVGNSEQLCALDHIDIFQSGLVASEDDSLWITEIGWSLLHALGISAQGWPDPDFASTSQSLNLIDDLIGTEARLKIFGRVSRSIDQNADETAGQEAPSRTARPDDPRLLAGSNDHPMDRDRRAAISNEASAHHRDGEIASDAPAFLIRKFGSGLRGASASSNPLSKLTERVRQGIGIWRRHLQQDQPPKETRRSGANMERGLFALLSLLVIVSCAGAVAALIQVKSLKSELTALQRELLPLKLKVAMLDQIEKSRETPDKVSDQKNQSSRESRAEEAPLLLSREEIQLIRDYIKPAPVAGSSTTPISVGDPVTGPTIPFPSPVTEKVPKLLGARFAIKNSTIIIVKKDSRQADAVLGPN
jgi:hypothetical protein